MRKIIQAVLLLVIGVAIGCDPDQVVVWSPDGSKAAVIGADGLHICDPAGKLTPLLVKDVRKVAWFGDSHRAAVAREVKIGSWKEATKYIEPERVARLEAEGEKLLKQMMAEPGFLDGWAEKLLKSPDGPSYSDFVGAALYLLERHPDEVQKKLTVGDWKKLQEGDGVSITLVQMYELSATEAKEGLILGSTFARVSELRPSPAGKVLAYVTAEGEKELCAIQVVPVDGTAQPRRVSDLCARYVDWSGDGKYLAYARANPPRVVMEDTLRLGTLRRVEVCEADGTLKAGRIEDTRDTPAESLAGVVFYDGIKVRWLRDGRIVFVSAEVNLPMARDDEPSKLSLFVIDPNKQATVSRLLTRKAEGEAGNAMQHFEINRDETLIAVPGTEGRMTVVALNGGKVTEVQAGKERLHMVPSWRTSDELCFAISNGNDRQNTRPAEVYLWRPGAEARCISKDWPEEVVKVMKQN